METKIARQLSDEMSDIIKRLYNSIRLVMDKCTPQGFIGYRAAVGRVMGALVLDILNPLYEKIRK
jgi:hypothetical protein